MSLEKSAQAGSHTKPEVASGTLPESIGVLVNYPLETEHIRSIEAVDLRVHVMRILEPRDADVQARAGVTWDDMDDWREVPEAQRDAYLAEADIYFGFGFQVEWLDRAARLKWISGYRARGLTTCYAPGCSIGGPILS